MLHRWQVQNIYTGKGAGWFFPDGFTQGGTGIARNTPATVYDVRFNAAVALAESHVGFRSRVWLE